MQTYLHVWYLAQFLLHVEWEMFQAEVAEKIKTHILRSTTSFLKIVPFMR